MFAVTLLKPLGSPIVVSHWEAWAVLAILGAAVVCGFMALPTKAKRIVAALVLAVGLTLGMAQLSAAEVPGLKCCDWIDLLWLCLDWWSC